MLQIAWALQVAVLLLYILTILEAANFEVTIGP